MSVSGFDLKTVNILNAEVKNESDFNKFINTLKNNPDLMVTDQGEIVPSGKAQIVWEKIKGSFGGYDHTQVELIRDRAFNIINEGERRGWIKGSNIEIIEDLAQRLGITLSPFLHLQNSTNEQLKTLVETCLKLGAEPSNASQFKGDYKSWIVSELNRIIREADQEFSYNKTENLKKIIYSLNDSAALTELLDSFCNCKNSELRGLALICLGQGADPNRPNSLIGAYSNSDTKLLDALLEKGADPLKKSENGKCVLDYCSTNDRQLVGALDHFKADADILKNYNDVPIWHILLKMLELKRASDSYLDYSILYSLLSNSLKKLPDLNPKDEAGLSLLQVVTKHHENPELLRFLVANGVKLEGTKEESEMTLMICEGMRSRPSNKLDVDFVEKLISQGFLPPSVYGSNIFIFNFCNKYPQAKDFFKIDAEVYLILKEMQDELKLKKLKGNDYSLVDKIESGKKLLKMVEKLKKIDFKYADLFENLLSDLYENLNEEQKILKWIERSEKDPSIGLEILIQELVGFRSKIVEDIFLVIIAQKKHSLLSNIEFAPRVVMEPSLDEAGINSKLVFAFFLDHNWLGSQRSVEHLEGLAFYLTIPMFVKGLRNTLELLRKNEHFSSSVLQTFISRMLDTLNLAQSIAVSYVEGLPTTLPESITVQQITSMTEDAPVWVPCGCKDHGTGLLLEKMGNGQGRLTLYNTGYGIEGRHERWKNEERFQLFYTIENIPLNNFADRKIWHEFFKLVETSYSMNPIYQFLDEKLGKDGTKPLPSEEKAFYSSPQFYGTCGAQNMMAMFEHQIKLLAPGTTEEKEAICRVLKTELLNQMISPHLEEEGINNQVHAVATEKLQKLSVERQICNIVSGSEFDKQFKQMLDFFSFVGEKELADVLKEKKLDSTAEKFFIFKLGLKHIYKIWAENPLSFDIIEPEKKNLLLLALNLQKSRDIDNQRVISFLDGLYEKKDLELRLNLNLLYFSHYRDLCIKWVKEKVAQSSSNEEMKPILIEFLKNKKLL